MPISNLETRKMMEKGGMFEKEARIYKEIFSVWPQSGPHFDVNFKWRPECYLARSDVIVLEDLRGEYRHISGVRELDIAHCQEMLKALAKLHASSLNFEKNALQGAKLDTSFGHLLFEVPLQEGNQWFKAGLQLIYFIAQKYPENFSDIEIPEKEEFMQVLNTIFKYRDEADDFEKVLCHRDIWYSNLFFKYSAKDLPEQCLIVDFQICSYKSPILDVLMGLYMTTRRQFRDEQLHNCCMFYLQYIERVLRETFNFSSTEVGELLFLKRHEFERARKHFLFYALVLNCIFIPLTHLPPGTLDRIQKADPRKYYELCNVDRNEFTHEMMQSDGYYRDYVLEVVRELLEYLFLGK